MAGINGGAINWIAMSTHVQPMLRGIVSSADLLWFALMIALSLALATRRLSADKERG
jgi:ABC-2 type transport system permease protein